MARRRAISLAALIGLTALLATAGVAQAGASITVVEGASAAVSGGSAFGFSPNSTVAGCTTTLPGFPIAAPTLSWGDGSSIETPTPVWALSVAGPLCTGTISGIHTYAAPGTYVATITSTTPTIGMGGPAATTTMNDATTIVVTPAPVSGTVTPWAATAGVSGSGSIATFGNGRASVTPARFLATVEWGDGVTSFGTLAQATTGLLTVAGSHTYDRSGAYTVKVTAIDLDGHASRTTFSGTINVAAQVATEGPGQSNLGKQCIVPKLVGLKLAAAKSAIAQANCKLGKVTAKKGTKANVGKVVKAPKVGAKLALNAKLNLTVGK